MNPLNYIYNFFDSAIGHFIHNFMAAIVNETPSMRRQGNPIILPMGMGIASWFESAKNCDHNP